MSKKEMKIDARVFGSKIDSLKNFQVNSGNVTYEDANAIIRSSHIENFPYPTFVKWNTSTLDMTPVTIHAMRAAL